MNPDYKLRVKDFVPYKGICDYMLRNANLLENDFSLKSPIRMKILEIYNVAFGVGSTILFSMNSDKIAHGLEDLLKRIM